MARRKRKSKAKRKKRIIFVTILCLIINGYMIYSISSIFTEVHQKKVESKKLVVELNDLKDEEDVLKSEVNKLKDPVYIGKYAREKFLYSGNDEFIIRKK